MRRDAVVRSYSGTLFELAGRHGGAESWEAPAALVADLLEDRRVRDFLATPRVAAAKKKAVLGRALGPAAPPTLLRFLEVVVDRGRQRLLPAIMRDFQDRLDRHRGIRHFEVAVAREIDADEERDLADRLSKATGATVVPTVRVRPEIVGGIVLREGDTLYDGSLKRQLDAMRRKLMAAELATPEEG